jgi:phage-related tail fiber protein
MSKARNIADIGSHDVIETDSDGVTVSGTVNATEFEGDGSALTGIEGMPAGSVIWFADSAAPTGYLKANGAEISRTTYDNLFTAIGTTFGTGDGSTTFDLPDLRGEFIRGWDDGRSVDSDRSFGSAQADELKSHGHYRQVLAAPGTGGGTAPYITGSTDGAYNGLFGGAETRPRNIALLACIKF